MPNATTNQEKKEALTLVQEARVEAIQRQDDTLLKLIGKIEHRKRDVNNGSN